MPKKEKASEVELYCLPKAPIPNVQEVYLFIQDEKPALIVGTKIVDALGGTNEMRFSNIKINAKIPSHRFKFQPPPGTEVITMGSGGINIK